jgi:dTDP-4-amino-4,6-dideoxygalactose transaminase
MWENLISAGYQRFLSLVKDIFERRWFSNNGKLVNELESLLSEYSEVKDCILVCNGTMGLQLATKALELTGEVIVPALPLSQLFMPYNGWDLNQFLWMLIL